MGIKERVRERERKIKRKKEKKKPEIETDGQEEQLRGIQTTNISTSDMVQETGGSAAEPSPTEEVERTNTVVV